MSRRIAFTLLVLVLAAPSLHGQNLVTNGAFTSDAAGWSSGGSSILALVYRDDLGSTLPGGSGPGALEVQLTAYNGGGRGAVQEVDVSAGTTYELRGSAYLPDDPDNVASGAAIVVWWLDSGGADLSLEWVYPPQQTRGAWLPIETTLVPPANAVRARLELTVWNPILPGETRPGVARFDDIWVAQEGVTMAVQSLFVPVASSKTGSNNTFWTTDLWAVNETSVAVQLSGAALRPGVDNTAAVGAPTTLGTVPAHGTLSLTDVLGSLGPGITGALYLEARAPGGGLPATLVTVASRNSTPSPIGAGGYGQYVAVRGPGTVNRVVVPGAYQNAAYRTNAILLNTSGTTLGVSVTVFRSDGTQAAKAAWTLQPYEPRLAGLPSMGVAALDGGYVVFERTSASGSFRASISVVDQKTGDSILIAP